MSPAAATSPVREGFRTVTPYLVVGQGNEYIEFLKQAFGAEETMRTATPGGFHAELRIGDSMLMVGGYAAAGSSRPPSLATLHYFVENPDEVYQRCLQLGAKSMSGPVEDYGERFAVVQDPAGNWWIIARSLTGSYRPEGRPGLNVFFNPVDASGMIEFLKNGLGAELLERHDAPEGAGVHYARLQVGDTVVEMGMARPDWQPTTMTLLYVPDSDALYRRALAAGAKSLSEPTDLPYGRSSGVTDLAGHQWYFVTPPAAPRG
jgi:PhnB protein